MSCHLNKLDEIIGKLSKLASDVSPYNEEFFVITVPNAVGPLIDSFGFDRYEDHKEYVPWAKWNEDPESVIIDLVERLSS